MKITINEDLEKVIKVRKAGKFQEAENTLTDRSIIYN